MRHHTVQQPTYKLHDCKSVIIYTFYQSSSLCFKTRHFMSLMISSLTLFINIHHLQGKVTSASAGSWFFVSWSSLPDHDHLCWGSMVLVTCPLQLSIPFLKCALWRHALFLCCIKVSETRSLVWFANLATFFCTQSDAFMWPSLYGSRHTAPYSRIGHTSDIWVKLFILEL